MTYWMCQVCGHCLNNGQPPEECPHCQQKCSFLNVTCYRPECGGEQNIDPLLTSAVSSHNLKNSNRRQAPNGLLS